MPGPIDSAGNTTPDYGAQASQLQSGLAATINQPSAPPPQYQAPADPVTQTFFGKLLTGALQGLAGGVRSGMINEAGRGTPGFKPDASGADYAHMLQEQQNNQDLANQKQAQEQAQQQFTNANETYRNQQAAIAQKAQAYQAQLNALHTAQAMQYATADQQRAYFKGEQDKEDHLNQNGVQSLGNFSDGNGQTATDKLAAWMKQNNKQISDFTQVHSQDAQGHDIIKVFDNPDHEVDADQINKELSAVGSPRRVSGSMNYVDKHALVTSEGAKAADQIYTQKAEQMRADLQLRNERLLESQRQAGAVNLERMKEAAAALPNSGGDPTQPLDPTLEKLIDAVHNGDSTPEQATKGMGTKAGQVNRAMQARYEAKYMDPKSPSYDPNAQGWEQSAGNFKAAYNDKNTQNVQAAGELYGTRDGAGKVVTQGAVADMKAKMQHLQQEAPALFSSGPLARGAAHVMNIAGNDVAEDIMANAPEIALRAAKFASGGNPSSDATYKATVAALERAKTPQALKAVMDGIDDTAGHTIASMKTNPSLARRLERVNDPGTHNDQYNAPANSENQSGAGQSIPPGMKLQRNKRTGETRLVPK
jgi:hypothetical protein